MKGILPFLPPSNNQASGFKKQFSSNWSDEWVSILLLTFVFIVGAGCFFVWQTPPLPKNRPGVRENGLATIKNNATSKVTSSNTRFALISSVKKGNLRRNKRNNLRKNLRFAMESLKYHDRTKLLSRLLADSDLDDYPELLRVMGAEFSDKRFKTEWKTLLGWSMQFAPEETARYALSGYDGITWKAQHLAASDIILKWLESDADSAARLLQSLPPNEVLGNAITAFGQELAIQNLEKAHDWVVGSDSPKFRRKALESVMLGVLEQGIHNDSKPYLLAENANWMLKFATEDYAVDAFRSWIGQVVLKDLEQSPVWIQWVIDLPDGTPRDAAAREFFRLATHISPVVLDDWIRVIDVGSTRDQATVGMVENLLFQHDGSSETVLILQTLVEEISDETLRDTSFEKIRKIISPDA